MKELALCSAILCLTVACSGGSPEVQSDEGQQAVDATPAATDTSEAASACTVLEGPMAELFDITPSDATFRPFQASGNDVCTVSWEIPDLDPQEELRRVQDPELRYNNEVSLTLMGATYDSAEAAVSSLEQTVTTLTEGIAVEVGGRERTVQNNFGEWIDDVGDRAIRGRRGNSLQVASAGRRFTAAVSVSDDEAENAALVVELAKRIITEL